MVARPMDVWLRRLPPALAFGLRVWASICLALFVAFWLQLENPFWAATSAAIVCQPSLGASLRKASFRLIGTCIGAAVLVLLAALFPQSPSGFLLCLALWCGMCGYAATVLRNFASYGAALAGYTAVIIAGDIIADPHSAFLLAIARATEICLGIACAGVVLLLTDRGRTRRLATALIAGVAADIWDGFTANLRDAGAGTADSTDRRRALVARVTALSAVLDELVGEASDVRARFGILQAAVDGLFDAVSEWRAAATRLETVSPAEARADAAAALASLPGALDAANWRTDPVALRAVCEQGARDAAETEATTPGSRLVAERLAGVLGGLGAAANGLVLLQYPARAERKRAVAAIRTPDPLLALLNGVRCALAVLAMSALWIATAWPQGPLAITFAAVVTLLLSPQGDAAFGGAVGFLAGTAITTVLAAVADFALLPGRDGLLALFLVIGLFVVPAAAMSTGNWRKSTFIALYANFIPLLGPSNPQVYDVGAFYNTALAIVVGVAGGVLSLVLLPSPGPALRARRLLGLTLRDLRRLASDRLPLGMTAWQGLMHGRLGVLPAAATPLQRSRMVAALWVGSEVLRLRRVSTRQSALQRAFAHIAAGDSGGARRVLAEEDNALAAADAARGDARHDAGTLRERAGLLGLSEALARHASFFDTPQPAIALVPGQEHPHAL